MGTQMGTHMGTHTHTHLGAHTCVCAKADTHNCYRQGFDSLNISHLTLNAFWLITENFPRDKAKCIFLDGSRNTSRETES